MSCTTCAEHGWSECFYCEMPLSPRHEHDHFPVPKSAGGTTTFPICLNCHDLKDRIAIDNWPVAMLFEAWRGMTPEARIFVARVTRIAYQDGTLETVGEAA